MTSGNSSWNPIASCSSDMECTIATIGIALCKVDNSQSLLNQNAASKQHFGQEKNAGDGKDTDV